MCGNTHLLHQIMMTRGGQAAKRWLDTWDYRMGGGTSMVMMPSPSTLTKQLKTLLSPQSLELTLFWPLITPRLSSTHLAPDVTSTLTSAMTPPIRPAKAKPATQLLQCQLSGKKTISVHAPDVRSTSNAASTSFCQGKCLKNETDHRLYQLTAGQAEAGAITSLIYW